MPADHTLRLRILGPFEASHGDDPVELPRGQLRWLLASFCLEPGRLLPEHRLIDQVWGAEGGSTSALRSSVSRLRTWLAQNGAGGAVEITHRGTGYAMTLPGRGADVLDAALAARRFEATRWWHDFSSAPGSALGRAADGTPLVPHGATTVRTGPAGTPASTGTTPPVDALLSVLSLWRGPVLADAPSALRHHPAAVELDHLRGRCALALAEAARAADRPGPAVDAVRQAAWDAPFDEQLQAAYVAVAMRAGRRTEALRHYDAVCRRIRTELGVEPSPALHAAVSQILDTGRRAPGSRVAGGLPARTGPAPVPAARRHADRYSAPVAALYNAAAAPPVGAPPAESHGLVPPPAAADFTGRGAALSQIVTSVRDHSRRSTVYVSGPPGIGKTELCLAATAEVRARGDIRVLFAQMDGSSGRPSAPYAVMQRFVQALDPGAPPASPEDPHALADRYRALLSAGPALVVLDDVAGADQVLPFLSPDPRCSLLASGRVAAPAVPGCTTLDLCSFTEQESREFVAAIIGAHRAASDPEALRRIHRLVDGHPTGLRIAALRLASNPHWSLRRLADLIADPAALLEVLDHDGLSIRRLLSAMVCGLDAELLAGLELLARAGAAAGAGPAVIERREVPELDDQTLDRLHGARLIGFAPVHGTRPAIWLSSLVRSYAAAGRRPVSAPC